MKQVHNIRVRVTDHDKDTTKQILDSLLVQAGIERKDIELLLTSDQDTEDPLFIGQLWIDHQPPVRKILALLKEKLSAADKERIKTKPESYLDIGTHFFVKLDKAKFLAGEYELVTTGSMVHLRLNVAAFPATKENAMKIVRDLLL